jgi:hypothetical protein
MIEQITVSIPQKLYRWVRDLARVRNQPVDDVLADVLEQALPADKSSPNNSEDDAVEREMQAFIQMHPMLKKKYLGQHVAIHNGQQRKTPVTSKLQCDQRFLLTAAECFAASAN